MKDDSRRDPLPVFSAGGPCLLFWHGQGCPLFDVDRPAFPLPTTASSTLQGTLRDGLGEAVVACDMSEPCKFPSLGVFLFVCLFLQFCKLLCLLKLYATFVEAFKPNGQEHA